MWMLLTHLSKMNLLTNLVILAAMTKLSCLKEGHKTHQARTHPNLSLNQLSMPNHLYNLHNQIHNIMALLMIASGVNLKFWDKGQKLRVGSSLIINICSRLDSALSILQILCPKSSLSMLNLMLGNILIMMAICPGAVGIGRVYTYRMCSLLHYHASKILWFHY